MIGGTRVRKTAVFGALGAALLMVAPVAAEPRHGLSAFGDLKYPADFSHFDYANPDAPKGGKISLIGVGGVLSYDSFNGYVLKGDAAQGLGLLTDSLMVRALDEPDAVYGLVAESADVAPDRRSVTFKLRASAKFSDGSPLNAADVVFTLALLKEKGHPQYAIVLRDVAGAEALDPLTVRYTFSGDQLRDLPLIVAGLPILSKRQYENGGFDASLTPPLGSGPYKIVDFKPGTFVTYQRRDDYWARDLPVNKGQFNFDSLRYEYFRDRTAALENFFNGTYDLREEFTSKDWANAYKDAAPVKDGRVKIATLPDDMPSGTQGFFLNTRRTKLADIRVRQALDLAFDFEWSNRNLFYGLYTRTSSYFENSPMKAQGAPSTGELALLEPFKAQLPAEVFGPVYVPPVTDGSGTDERKFLREAANLLEAAGFKVKDGKRLDAAGQPFDLEFLIHEEGFERLILPYVAKLQKLGIDARIRRVDNAQYEQRTKTFDFDIAIQRRTMQLTPGIELKTFFGSAAASINGSFNLAGIKDPVVDALIDKIIDAKSRADLETAASALDRVLRAGHYWVSHYYKAAHNIAYWDKFQRPAVSPRYDGDPGTWSLPLTWWYDPAKAANIAAGKAN